MNTSRLFKAELEGKLDKFLDDLTEQQTKLLIQQFRDELKNYENVTKNYSDEKFQKFSVPHMAKRMRYLNKLTTVLIDKVRGPK